jgi:hypothetical protein
MLVTRGMHSMVRVARGVLQRFRVPKSFNPGRPSDILIRFVSIATEDYIRNLPWIAIFSLVYDRCCYFSGWGCYSNNYSGLVLAFRVTGYQPSLICGILIN